MSYESYDLLIYNLRTNYDLPISNNLPFLTNRFTIVMRVWQFLIVLDHDTGNMSQQIGAIGIVLGMGIMISKHGAFTRKQCANN